MLALSGGGLSRNMKSARRDYVLLVSFWKTHVQTWFASIAIHCAVIPSNDENKKRHAIAGPTSAVFPGVCPSWPPSTPLEVPCTHPQSAEVVESVPLLATA